MPYDIPCWARTILGSLQLPMSAVTNKHHIKVGKDLGRGKEVRAVNTRGPFERYKGKNSEESPSPHVRIRVCHSSSDDGLEDSLLPVATVKDMESF